MATTIITRTYSAIQDNRASLSVSSFARPFNAGNWNSIRVCARLSINGSATVTLEPHYALGLCSGPTTFNGSTTQFVGIIGNLGGSSMSYIAGPPACNATRHYVGTKVGASMVGTSGLYASANNSEATNGYISRYENAGAPMRDLMFATITRPGGATIPTSGQYAVSMFVRSSQVVFNDVSLTDFLTQAVAATPVITGSHTNYGIGTGFSPYLVGTGTVFVDELTYGPLDHVMAGWNKSAATIEVSDIGFVRML